MMNVICGNNRITPFQGLAFAGHSFRRALPCAIDYRAFSPALSKYLAGIKNKALAQ
jgi:hypothetical protein